MPRLFDTTPKYRRIAWAESSSRSNSPETTLASIMGPRSTVPATTLASVMGPREPEINLFTIMNGRDHTSAGDISSLSDDVEVAASVSIVART